MSTRSFNGMVNRDFTITSVYCHWDGYVEFNGKMLLEHYNTPAKVRKLLHKGDFSSLQENISDIQYYVDRGDEDTGQITQSLDDFIKMCKIVIHITSMVYRIIRDPFGISQNGNLCSVTVSFIVYYSS